MFSKRTSGAAEFDIMVSELSASCRLVEEVLIKPLTLGLGLDKYESELGLHPGRFSFYSFEPFMDPAGVLAKVNSPTESSSQIISLA